VGRFPARPVRPPLAEMSIHLPARSRLVAAADVVNSWHDEQAGYIGYPDIAIWVGTPGGLSAARSLRGALALQGSGFRTRERVVPVRDRSLLVELIKLILKHRAYATRTVATVAEATTALAAWQPTW
jgi:hypothetical protein